MQILSLSILDFSLVKDGGVDALELWYREVGGWKDIESIFYSNDSKSWVRERV